MPVFDLLYIVFIYPIEFTMRLLLNGLFFLTNSYGLSVIFLSFFINILILPLYFLAEKYKKKYDTKLNFIKPKLDFLKKKYSGYELHSYQKCIYKIYKINPFDKIKSSFGLLLQIPFFFAAFHFLGNYQHFDNISFLFISDLNKSDNLLFSFNLLPILMTLINLFSTYIYAKSISNFEKYQIYFLSALFFILLYNEPAALLLYWTCNNIFSLIKNYLENKFNFDIFKNNVLKIFTIPRNFIKKIIS